MNALALIVVLVFWIPAAIVIIYNFFWDIRFWQLQDYRFDRLFQHLRWDFEITHRRPLYTAIKLVLFALAASFLFYPAAIAPLIAVAITFALWVNETFTIFEKILGHRFPYLEASVRNILMLIIAIVATGILPVLLSLYLLSVNPPELAEFGTSLLPTVTNAGVAVLPLTYIFLVFSTLLAITYDMASPVITAAVVLITTPVAWLETQFYRLVAYVIIRRRQHLLTIAITGSHSKTTTKLILQHILHKSFHVSATDVTETSLQRIALSIITGLHPGTEIFIADINGYSRGQMSAMTELLNPQIAVVTGVDSNHVGLYGSMEATLDVKSELVRNVNSRARIIYNGDDEVLMRIAGKYHNSEIFYSTNSGRLEPADNDLKVDDYRAANVQTKGHRLQFTLQNQTREIEMDIPIYARHVMNSLLGAIAAAAEAGMSLEAIREAVFNLPQSIFSPEMLAGDNNTLLIVDGRKLSPKGLDNLLDTLRAVVADQRIVVTTGISQQGKHKRNLYTKLAAELRTTADVLITYDMALIDAVTADNSKLQIVAVSHIDELIYAVRTVANEGAAILLAGELDPGIVAALRDE